MSVPSYKHFVFSNVQEFLIIAEHLIRYKMHVCTSIRKKKCIGFDDLGLTEELCIFRLEWVLALNLLIEKYNCPFYVKGAYQDFYRSKSVLIFKEYDLTYLVKEWDYTKYGDLKPTIAIFDGLVSLHNLQYLHEIKTIFCWYDELWVPEEDNSAVSVPLVLGKSAELGFYRWSFIKKEWELFDESDVNIISHYEIFHANKNQLRLHYGFKD